MRCSRLTHVWRFGSWLLLLWAVSLSVWAQSRPLDLASAADRLELRDHLSILHDPSTDWLPLQAMAQEGWRGATEQSLHPGLVSAAIWLRVELYNSGTEQLTRWLSLGNPRLEHAHLYRIDGQGLSGPQRSGLAYPPPVSISSGRDALFEITLPPGEHWLVLLRVESRTAIGLNPQLWEPQAYLVQEEADDLRYLAPIGLMLGLVLYLLANTLALGNRVLFLFALLILMGTLYDFAFYGYFRRYLMPAGGDLAARLPNLLALLSTTVLVFYIHALLEMGQQRFWRYFYPFFGVAFFLFALLTLFGDLRWSIAASTILLMLFYLSWPLSMFRPWRDGSVYIRAFIVALIFLWAFTVFRVLSFLGYWQVSSLVALYVGVIFKLVMAFVLLFSVVRYSASESRAFTTMQSELLRAQRQESERLEAAVRVRSEALRKAAVDADEAVRAKSELLARVGHDLRAPLSTIMAYAQRLEAIGGEVFLRAQAIRRSAREQLALINGLIEYARAGAQPDAVLTQPLYLEAWLRSVASQAQGMASKQQAAFEFVIKGELPTVVVIDPKRARQVLQLLFTHAAERCAQGRIEFVVEAVPPAEPGDRQATCCLVFTVRDEGPPITAEQMATLFKPFLRLGLEQAHQEVRLGLAVAHQWAARMGGNLQALHASNRGASLRFSLPVALGHESDIAPRHLQRREVQLPELRGSGLQIWLAEDSPAVRELLTTELSGLGFEVTAMSNGREALDRLRALKVLPPDLMLTDLSMPGVDGLTLQRSIRARWPGLPVVLLTSAPEVIAHQEHGFDAVLSKPVSLVELRHVLADLLNLDLIMPPKLDPEA